MSGTDDCGEESELDDAPQDDFAERCRHVLAVAGLSARGVRLLGGLLEEDEL